MLANHVYWNLGAFVNQEASTVLKDTLYMPYSARAIQVDNILVPTGGLEIVKGTPLDFTSPKQIGQDIANAHQCGFNCTGYDNSFILDRPRYSAPEATDLTVLTLSSPVTGIQMDIRTNQQNLQIYTCGNMNGSIPVKASQQHGPATTYVPQYGCVSVSSVRVWDVGCADPVTIRSSSRHSSGSTASITPSGARIRIRFIRSTPSRR